MTTHPMNPARSEKGVALIIVLLLLAVMAGLTTGLTLNGQTEIAMAHNETYYAGARAAAEAGMNRAVEQIIGDTSTDLLATTTIPNIGNGEFQLNEQYSYRFEIIDDDDPSLYATPLTPEQLARMGENGDGAVNLNTRMLLRCIATGPRGTTVTVTRVLSSIEIPDLPESESIITNPAILVNGDLDIAGDTKVLGLKGNVHANGDITGGGSEEISGDLTATGEIDDDLEAGGLVAGNMPPITVPEIKASDFFNLADYVLTSDGNITIGTTGVPCSGTSGPGSCPEGWSFSDGTWSASGSMPTTGTYYVQGDVEMHGTGTTAKSFTQLSLIAEGSIKITGNGKFKPENDQKIQFVTNGDFELSGTADADDSVDMDGQIMVREQIKIDGTSEFQGRVMVENRDGDTNAYDPVSNPNGRRGESMFSDNSLAGTMTVTYNGGLGDIETILVTPGGPSSYTNNISGWIEQ